MSYDEKFLDVAIRHPKSLTLDGALKLFDHVQGLRAQLVQSQAEVAALKAQNEKIAEMRIQDCEDATKAEAEVGRLREALKEIQDRAMDAETANEDRPENPRANMGVQHASILFGGMARRALSPNKSGGEGK